MPRTAMETHPTGTYFDFANPQPDMVHVEDIARALSQTNRFGGHTSRPYAVAEHSLLVSRLVREAGGSIDEQFAAIHHDSHETYLGDLPTPAKNYLQEHAPGAWDELVWSIDVAIALKFDIAVTDFHSAIIKAADAEALAIEAAVLKVSRGVGPHWPASHTRPAPTPTGAVACWDAAWAEHMFLTRHYALAGDLAMQRLGGGA